MLLFLLYGGDLAATLLAFLGAYSLRDIFPQESYQSLYPFSWYLNLLAAIIPIWSFLFYLNGLYTFWRGPGFWKESWNLAKALFFSSLILGFTVFAMKFQFVSRIFLLLFLLFDFLLILLSRFVIRVTILRLHQKHENFRILLIIGTEGDSLALSRSIEKHKDQGLRLLGFLSTDSDAPPQRWNGHPVLGPANSLPKLLEKEVVDEVIFVVSAEKLKEMEDLFLLCEERGITARVSMSFFPHLIARTHLEDLDGLPLLTFTTAPKNDVLLLLRRVLDFSGSLFLLLFLAPVFLLIALLIRMDSSGPVLYRQVRCGLNGRKFTFYKFRSMVQGAEAMKSDLETHNLMNGPAFKMKNDPRVTRVGRFLRKTSLDELPQLINVLRGDMSFVGPRPPLPEEVEKYEGWQRRRLSMKPGITGLWQVSGRNAIDFREWMKLDLEYIDNWSLWLDLKILLKTIPVVLMGKGAM